MADRLVRVGYLEKRIAGWIQQAKGMGRAVHH